ncbi:hypothetical protein, partial [Enhygromyxa salina]|uniref:hypothetical protein n=1 Tax=Enhygromyxa salina TaxID=215803 RepID=UPI001969CF76
WFRSEGPSDPAGLSAGLPTVSSGLVLENYVIIEHALSPALDCSGATSNKSFRKRLRCPQDEPVHERARSPTPP